jgi:hypothetical protein
MVVPDTDIARVRRHCEAQNRHDHTDSLRIDFEVLGNDIVLFEDRAPWNGKSTERMREDFAKMRWSPSNRHWTLYCMDGNLKWHKYSEIGPGPIQTLLDEVDDDPTCIFKG